MKTQYYLKSGYLDAARDFLSPGHDHISDQQVAGVLFDAMEQMSPMERDAFANLSLQYAGESFWKDLGKGIGRVASKALPYIAPVAKVAAPLVGTVFGGPAGGAVGAKLAGLLGRVASPQRQCPQQVSRKTAILRRPSPPPAPAPATPTNPAATQLMSLLANPQLLQALLGQVLGAAGNSTANIAGDPRQNIPFGAMMGTLSELALQAADESVRLGVAESSDYLTDAYGNSRLADNSPEAQAEVVMGILREDYEWRQAEAEEYEEGYGDEEDEESPCLCAGRERRKRAKARRQRMRHRRHVGRTNDHPEDGYDEVTNWLVEADLIKR